MKIMKGKQNDCVMDIIDYVITQNENELIS